MTEIQLPTATDEISTRTIWAALILAIFVVAAFFLSDAVPQDPAYHDFADKRTMFGFANFFNAASNLPLFAAGAWGIITTLRHRGDASFAPLRIAYFVFFSGILLSSLGSAYYHSGPDDGSLFWDRLPMTIAFSGLFVVIVGEYVSASLARKMLLPLLLAGACSAIYWAITESAGSGDLRPYAIVQFLPMVMIPAILLSHPDNSNLGRSFWLMIGFYFLAKVAENLDVPIFNAGFWVSGHTLKHLFAALAPMVLISGLMNRGSVRE